MRDRHHAHRHSVPRTGTLPRLVKVIITGSPQRGRISTVLVLVDAHAGEQDSRHVSADVDGERRPHVREAPQQGGCGVAVRVPR